MPSSNVPWELGCGPADPGISRINGPYSTVPGGSGYGARGGSGEVGTINAGASTPVGAQFPPAQVRFYLSGGTLYALDNSSGQAYFLSASAVIPVPSGYTPLR